MMKCRATIQHGRSPVLWSAWDKVNSHSLHTFGLRWKLFYSESDTEEHQPARFCDSSTINKSSASFTYLLTYWPPTTDILCHSRNRTWVHHFNWLSQASIVRDATAANQVRRPRILACRIGCMELTATWHSCCSQPCYVQETTENSLFNTAFSTC